MNKQEIMRHVDHTILTTTATWEQVQAICEQGLKYNVASVCIPPRHVKKANQFLGGRLKICTVIGFPNGYNTPEVKVFEEGGEFYIEEGQESALAYAFNFSTYVPTVLVKGETGARKYVKMKNSL